MIILIQNTLRSITTVFFGCLLVVNRINTNPYDWKSVEAIAEEYPYIVGLLDNDKQYVCTGILINNWTVLTSGDCLSPEPSFITASAVLDNDLTGDSFIKVHSSTTHSECTFSLSPGEPNSTQVHSNLGLVFPERPVLNAVLEHAKFGYYYASELRDRTLTVVGFGYYYASELRDRALTVVGHGEPHTGRAVLRKHNYHQMPCLNPRWYYCVCGIENLPKIDDEFGRGGPVFVGTELVGVAAAPCGLLDLPGAESGYNIFTVIGPYLPWITKMRPRPKPTFRMVSQNSHNHKEVLIKYIVLLSFIRNLINNNL